MKVNALDLLRALPSRDFSMNRRIHFALEPDLTTGAHEPHRHCGCRSGRHSFLVEGLWESTSVCPGLLFSLIGLMLTCFDLIRDKSIYKRSMEVNVNIEWGVVLLVFGEIFLVFGSRGGRSGARS